MEAFYVSIIFLGVLLVIGSLFFIAMDKVNGKDFFKEFDRKKEEMFNLIQDSEEMVQELNRLSDYVVNVISDKNQEFFEKVKKSETANKAYNPYQASMAMSKVPRPVERVKAADIENNAAEISGSDNEDTLIPAIKESASQNAGEDNVQKIAARQKEVSKQKNASRQKEVSKQKDAFRQKDISEQKDTSQQRDISEQKDAAQQRDISEQKDAAQQRDISNQKDAPQQKDISEQKEINHGTLNSQMSSITERLNEQTGNKSKLVLNGKRREVLQMIDQGMSNDEIADKLKIGKGEIGLIRGLSK